MTENDDRLAVLRAAFPPAEVRQFTKDWTGKDGQHHSMTFDYIEDERVMERLDDVFGLGSWSVQVSPVSEMAVKVRLSIRIGDDWIGYEDFGYTNRADSAEPLKEAVSDGIRRCGRYLGIGRYLYLKHDSPAGRVASSARPVSAAPGADSAPAPGAEPPEDARDGHYGPTCPKHLGRAWKTTAYGDKCTAQDPDGRNGYCIWKPNRRWIAEHEVTP